MRDVSRIRAAAERIRWIGSTVTDPADAAIIYSYANELDARATRLIGKNTAPRVFWPHPGFAEAQLPMLRKSLRRVLSVEATGRFDKVLQELDGVEAGGT